jgi:hypothetical protein
LAVGMRSVNVSMAVIFIGEGPFAISPA